MKSAQSGIGTVSISKTSHKRLCVIVTKAFSLFNPTAHRPVCKLPDHEVQRPEHHRDQHDHAHDHHPARQTRPAPHHHASFPAYNRSNNRCASSRLIGLFADCDIQPINIPSVSCTYASRARSHSSSCSNCPTRARNSRSRSASLIAPSDTHSPRRTARRPRRDAIVHSACRSNQSARTARPTRRGAGRGMRGGWPLRHRPQKLGALLGTRFLPPAMQLLKRRRILDKTRSLRCRIDTPILSLFQVLKYRLVIMRELVERLLRAPTDPALRRTSRSRPKRNLRFGRTRRNLGSPFFISQYPNQKGMSSCEMIGGACTAFASPNGSASNTSAGGCGGSIVAGGSVEDCPGHLSGRVFCTARSVSLACCVGYDGPTDGCGCWPGGG